jgi:hypothetical protein
MHNVNPSKKRLALVIGGLFAGALALAGVWAGTRRATAAALPDGG